MDFPTYKVYFKAILEGGNQLAPYNDPDYLNYTKLNWSRQERWLKKAQLNEQLLERIKSINQIQHWIVITEPWCGDAAHSLPILYMLSQHNPLIKLDIQLRDSEPFLINQYLTRGGKSVPKLIIRDESGSDLLVWGPRPEASQILYDKLKAQQAGDEELKLQLQWWYNEDKGERMQQELLESLPSMV